MINDLPSCVNSKVRLFADDCLFYREIKNNQDQIDMQRDLDALMDWGSTWGMKFNAKKCNIMRVSRSRKPLQHFYSLGNEILQEVSDAKYLGIQIDNKLDWNKHISTVAARGQSKLAFLNRNLKGCPKKLRDTAYISLIRPALEYSCSVWHPHFHIPTFIFPYLIYCVEVWGSACKTNLTPIMLLQKKVVRILSFSDRLEHTEPLFIRLDILPFNKLIHHRIGLFMYKVYKDMYPTVITNMYLHNKNIHSHNTRQNITFM